MRVGSTFSGVGGLDLGLERAGLTVVFQAEVDEWRRRVLAERFPGTVVFDDVRAVGADWRERAGSDGGDRAGAGRDERPAGGVHEGDEGAPPRGHGAVGGSGPEPDAGRGRARSEDGDHCDPPGRAPRGDREDAERGRGGRGAAAEPVADDLGAGRELHADGRAATVGAAGGIDLLCGGFPCQDLSVAGKRAGLAGERSGLFFEFARIADELRPRWILLENVVGLLSSADGRDFAVVLSTLADLGYGVAWRVLDARYFGVPQRRRRVFIVGCAGGEPEPALRALAPSVQGDPETVCCSWQTAAPRARPGAAGAGGEGPGAVGALQAGRKGQRLDADSAAGGHLVSPAVTRKWAKGNGGPAGDECQNLVVNALTARFGTQSGHDLPDGENGHLIPVGGPEVAAPLTKGSAVGQGVSAPGRRQEDDVNLIAFHGVADDPVEGELVPPLTQRGHHGVTAPALTASNDPSRSPQSAEVTRQVDTLRAAGAGVRRLTPVECERLMGWPDDWTAIDGEKTPDSRRYAACGDGVVSNVAEWLARRIAAVDAELS